MILIDTGPLVALCDTRDARHRVAVSHLGRIASDQLALCDAVLAEACFHLPHPSQRIRLSALVDRLHIEVLVTHEAVFHAAVFAWLLKYADHEPDWADACLAVLCGRDPASKVWTYDREFKTIWRKPSGKAIPLAVRF